MRNWTGPIYDENGLIYDEYLNILAEESEEFKQKADKIRYIVVGEMNYDEEKGTGRGPFYDGFETLEEAEEYVRKNYKPGMHIMGPRLDVEEE